MVRIIIEKNERVVRCIRHQPLPGVRLVGPSTENNEEKIVEVRRERENAYGQTNQKRPSGPLIQAAYVRTQTN